MWSFGEGNQEVLRDCKKETTPPKGTKVQVRRRDINYHQGYTYVHNRNTSHTVPRHSLGCYTFLCKDREGGVMVMCKSVCIHSCILKDDRVCWMCTVYTCEHAYMCTWVQATQNGEEERIDGKKTDVCSFSTQISEQGLNLSRS